MKKFYWVAFVSFLFVNANDIDAIVNKRAPRHETFVYGEENGTFSATLKLFYMARIYDGNQTDSAAFNGGGIFKYESKTFHGFKLGMAYYGSHRIGGLYTRDEGIGTFMLQKNGDDIHFLGEAYLQYVVDKTKFKIGRQQLVTPILKKIEERLLPTVYQAATVKNKDIPKTLVEVGYVNAFTGFGSRLSGFEKNERMWGDEGVGYIYIENKSFKRFSVRAQYVRSLSDTYMRRKKGTQTLLEKKAKIKDYRYFDFKYTFLFNKNIHLRTKVQYLQNTYYREPDAKALRFIATVPTSKINFIIEWDRIRGNHIRPWYGRLEPSSGKGCSIVFKHNRKFRLKFRYLRVDTLTEKYIDDFVEYSVNLKYKIDHRSTFRTIVNIRDQSSVAEKLFHEGKGGREDRTDIRIVYSWNF